MKKLPFKASSIATVGVELEYQLINPRTHGLASHAKNLIRRTNVSRYHLQVKPEINQSMIELNSSVHHSIGELLEELFRLRDFLLKETQALNALICGGGLHPLQKWSREKVFPNSRYRNLYAKYQYLSKQAPVFGQHIHVGCETGDMAIYLTHAFARYVPQFIALSASSPFFEGYDTRFFSARTTLNNSFPLSGVMPIFKNWKEFSTYFNKMKNYGIVETMKDFYWDIRPKPEFGTVEIRVCDTPLTINKAALITAYVQAIALHLLEERPFSNLQNLYDLYEYNNFQACRYGFKGHIIDPVTGTQNTIFEDIKETLTKIEPYVKRLKTEAFIMQLKEDILSKKNDAAMLRRIFKNKGSLRKMVAEQCRMLNL